MATENIRNSVANSSVLHESHYALSEQESLYTPKRKHDSNDVEERMAKRPRLSMDFPTPLPLSDGITDAPLPTPVIATLASPKEQRWVPQHSFVLHDFPPPPMSTPMTPWLSTPTNAIPVSDGYYPSFSLMPAWDTMSGSLANPLYHGQLQNIFQVLSPGASIVPLLVPPVLADNEKAKNSPLLEPDNHKFYDHPALLQKLSLSKSPVLEAVIYCALNKWGIEMLPFGPDKKLSFKVTDFDKFSVYSAKINSKGKPTTDVSSRVKALRRWFDGIPKVKDRKITFIMSVKGSDDKHSKVEQLVDKVTAVYQSRLAAVQNPDGLAQGIE